MSNDVEKRDVLPTLVQYNGRLDLVEVRSNPEKFPRIKSTPREEAVSRMLRMVYGAFLYRGQEPTPEMVKFIAGALVDEIVRDVHYGMGELSWVEIGMVIRRAVLGGARDMYGVSVASLFSALVDYVKAEGHEADRRAKK